MGMPAILSHYWTAEEVLAIPDSPPYRFEAVDGELFVSPAPPIAHQLAIGELFVRLKAYVERCRIGKAVTSPFDVVADKLTVVHPDVFVLPLVDGRPARSWREAGRLLLAIEVLSPSSDRADRFAKRAKYSQMGTEYWLVDLEARVIERWMPGTEEPQVVREVLRWTAPGTEEAMEIDLQEVMARAWGELL